MIFYLLYFMADESPAKPPSITDAINIIEILGNLIQAFSAYPTAPWGLITPYLVSMGGILVSIFAYKMWPFK